MNYTGVQTVSTSLSNREQGYRAAFKKEPKIVSIEDDAEERM